nr:PH108-4-56(-) [Vibrio phage 1]
MKRLELFLPFSYTLAKYLRNNGFFTCSFSWCFILIRGRGCGSVGLFFFGSFIMTAI